MSMKLKFKLGRFYSRHELIFAVLLLLAIVLVFSCFISTVNSASQFTSGNPDKIVSNETELREAINNAPTKKPFIIALNNDITLTDTTLIIPANKNIILTSNKATNYYKLIGTAHGTVQFMVGEFSVSTITVNDDAILELDGIGVTHACDYRGYVVGVTEKGQLIMHSGLISSDIGGISNNGVFLMYDGEISGNSAIEGGGVFNRGTFTMLGGKISGNNAWNQGGGVYNEDTFEMLGGEISDNTAATGGGIYNWGGATSIEYKYTSSNTKEFGGYGNQYSGSFTLSGGVISGNTAGRGGGVENQGVFIMSGGVISDNTATGSGGGVSNGQTIVSGNFEMSGGEISANTAEKGGGVYNFFYSIVSLMGSGVISDNTAELCGGVCIDGDFNMSGGMISGNIASNGGGVYLGNGIFKLSGGEISKNTATHDGGGIWVDNEKLDQLFVSNGVIFSSNHASGAYDRDSMHDSVYRSQIGNRVTWTTPFTQGYNNYDISYTSDNQVEANILSYWVITAGLSILVTWIGVVCVFLYFKKRRGKIQTAPQNTPTQSTFSAP